jgi:hypothetical protein
MAGNLSRQKAIITNLKLDLQVILITEFHASKNYLKEQVSEEAKLPG